MIRKSLFFVLACLILTSTGCAGLGKKFSSSVQADIGYFTDTTVTMMRDVNFGFTRGGRHYSKEFFTLTEPEEIAYIDRTEDVNLVLKSIVRYSMRLVSITEASGNEASQVKAYADYLVEIEDRLLVTLGLEREYYDRIVEEVRKQHELLDALRSAQPFINAMGRYVDHALDNANDATVALFKKAMKRVDTRFAKVVHYQQALDREKYDSLNGLEYIYLAIRKDPKAYKMLLKSGQIRDPKLIPQGKPTYDQLTKMSEHILKRLDVMNRVGKEVEPDWQRYRETQKEIWALQDRVIREVKQFRLITLTWVRAHQKMSSGKMKPAEWFDINDAPGKLIKAGIDVAL